MVKGLYTAYTGMIEEQRRLEVLSNNLANSATVGYKKEGTVNQAFERDLAIKIKDTSFANGMPRGIGDVQLGVKIGETYTNYDQGSMQITDKETDLALGGEGFFAIEFTSKAGETSIKYTRDGSFSVDADGYLVTVDGDHVLNQYGALNSVTGEAGYVQVNPNLPIIVDKQGFVFQNDVMIAQIGVVDIDNYDYLAKYGENLYDLVEGGNILASDATIEQGCLEASNVNVVDEMVNMIAIARAFEAGQKVIQTEDQTLDKAVNTVGRV